MYVGHIMKSFKARVECLFFISSLRNFSSNCELPFQHFIFALSLMSLFFFSFHQNVQYCISKLFSLSCSVTKSLPYVFLTHFYKFPSFKLSKKLPEATHTHKKIVFSLTLIVLTCFLIITDNRLSRFLWNMGVK